MLMNEWCKRWLKDKRTQVKRRTYFAYKDIIERHILPQLGEKPLSDVTSDDFRTLIEEKLDTGNVKSGKGLSSNSVNLIIAVIKGVFRGAYEEELIDKNPADRIRRVRVTERRAEALSIRDEGKIRKHIEESGDNRLTGILIAMDTGMRVGEILALTWDDIDFKRGVISVYKTRYRVKTDDGKYEDVTDEPKTKSSVREIPLPPSLAARLKKMKKEMRSEYVITNKSGERMSIRSYQYIFKRLQEKLGLKALNFHCLRHTFATRAVECGVDIKTVSELLGHKSASLTVNRYAHSLWETKRKAVFRVSKILSEHCG